MTPNTTWIPIGVMASIVVAVVLGLLWFFDQKANVQECVDRNARAIVLNAEKTERIRLLHENHKADLSDHEEEYAHKGIREAMTKDFVPRSEMEIILSRIESDISEIKGDLKEIVHVVQIKQNLDPAKSQ